MPIDPILLQRLQERRRQGKLPPRLRSAVRNVLKEEQAPSQLTTPIDIRQAREAKMFPTKRPKPLGVFEGYKPPFQLAPAEPFERLEEKFKPKTPYPIPQYEKMVEALFTPSELLAKKIAPEGATGEEVLKNSAMFGKKIAESFTEFIPEGAMTLADTGRIFIQMAKGERLEPLPEIEIPFYGKISSLQRQTEKAVGQGMDPYVAILYHGGVATLDIARMGLLIDAGAKAILANVQPNDMSMKAASQVLGVPPSQAGSPAVKEAYWNLSKIYHPDSPSGWGSDEAMAQLTKAYTILQSKATIKYAIRDLAQVLETPVSDILAGKPLTAVKPFIHTLIPERAGMMPEAIPAKEGLVGALERQPVGLVTKEVPLIQQEKAIQYFQNDLKMKFGPTGRQSIPELSKYAERLDLSKAKTIDEAVKTYVSNIPTKFKGSELVDTAIKEAVDTANVYFLGGLPEKATEIPSAVKPFLIPTVPPVEGLLAKPPITPPAEVPVVAPPTEVPEKITPILTPAEIKPTELKSTIKNLIRERYSQISTGLVDTRVFTNSIEKSLTPQQRKRIPFIIEGTDKGTPELNEWADKVGQYYDEGHKFLADNLDEVGFVENYVNRIWDIPANKRAGAVSRFTTKNPFFKKRKIPTLQEGIDMGLIPKTTDISELIKIYDEYKVKVVANKRFVDGLNALADENNVKLIQRIDKAPADWKVIDHSALRRAIGIPIEEGKVLLPKIPVKVHPEIAREVEVVLGRPFSGRAARALDTINAFSKKTALSLSLFFHWSIGEAGVSAGIPEKVLKMWNPGEIYSAFKTGNYGILRDIPLTKDALNHGLQLGPISDVQADKVSRVLKGIENRMKGVPIVNKVATGVRGFNEIWDKALWDYYHNSMKLFAYENWVQSGIKKAPNMPVEQIKSQVAQLVNDTFGGQVWENLLVTPKGQQVAHWILLSPDWALSTLRQAQAPFSKGIRGKLGRGFWLRVAVYFGLMANIINGVMSEKHLGEWRWMWENDPKHKTLIFIGYDENGQKKYLRAGKQFREIFEWIHNPSNKFGSKLAPPLREAITQLTGYSTTGWKTEWADKKFYDPEALEARAKHLMNLGAPYSISTITRSKNVLGIMFPIQKGLSWYEARELMMDAIEKKDKDYLAEIWRAALENNLDARSIFDSSKSELKVEKRWKYKDIRNLINKLKKMGKEEGMKKIQEMRKSGELTPEIEKQMKNVLETEAEVKLQRRRLGF